MRSPEKCNAQGILIGEEKFNAMKNDIENLSERINQLKDTPKKGHWCSNLPTPQDPLPSKLGYPLTYTSLNFSAAETDSSVLKIFRKLAC